MANETVREEVRRIAEAARAASGALAQTSAEERNGGAGGHGGGVARACGGDRRGERPRTWRPRARRARRRACWTGSCWTRGASRAWRRRSRTSPRCPTRSAAVQDARTLESGIELERVSVPLGVVAVVYEARPNVTADAAGICLKSGNAAVLRGGSMAAALERGGGPRARRRRRGGRHAARVHRRSWPPPTARRPTSSCSCTGRLTCSSRAAARGSSATAWRPRRCRSSRRARATATCTCTGAPTSSGPAPSW